VRFSLGCYSKTAFFCCSIAAENAAFFSNKQPNQIAPSIEAMSGITLRFTPDTQRLVAQRRAAQAPQRAAIATA